MSRLVVKNAGEGSRTHSGHSTSPATPAGESADREAAAGPFTLDSAPPHPRHLDESRSNHPSNPRPRLRLIPGGAA